MEKWNFIEHQGNLIRVTSGLDDATREWLATNEAAKLKDSGELYADYGYGNY